MARAILPRFELTVLKDRTASDHTQVPAEASINFFRQGATVATTVTVYPGLPPATIAVLYSGQIEVGDTLRAGTSSVVFSVLNVLSMNAVYVSLDSPQPLVLEAGTRLWVTSNRPSLFADPVGTVSLGSSLTTAASNGRASAYVSLDRFDYEVVVSGQATRFYLDQAAVMGRSDQLWNDIRDFGGSLQAAVDALPEDGGVVFVPRGVWSLTAGVTIGKPNVTIVGEGAGSVLKAGTANAFDLLTIAHRRFRLRDLTLDGNASAYSASGKCCAVVAGSSGEANEIYFENVWFTRAPRFGLWIKDAMGCLAEQCHFDANKGSGVRVESVQGETAAIGFTACTFRQNGLRGVEAYKVNGLRFTGCTFDGNRGGTGEFEGNAIEVTECQSPAVVSSSFRSADTTTRPTNFAAFSQCLSPQADGCYFDGGATEPKRPVQAVVFDRSPGSRMSNCLGNQLKDFLGRFQQGSVDSLEMCNAEVETLASNSLVRLRIDVGRMTSLSRRVLSIPILASTAERPTGGITPGSMIWVNGGLETWTGTTTEWKRLQLTS